MFDCLIIGGGVPVDGPATASSRFKMLNLYNTGMAL